MGSSPLSILADRRMWNVRAWQHQAHSRHSTDVSWLDICMSPFANDMRFYPWAWDVASTSEYVQGTPRWFSVCLTADLSYWSVDSSRKQSDFKGNKIVKHVYVKIDLKYFMALDTGLAISIHYNKNLISWTQCFKTKRQMTRLYSKSIFWAEYVISLHSAWTRAECSSQGLFRTIVPHSEMLT